MKIIFLRLHLVEYRLRFLIFQVQLTEYVKVADLVYHIDHKKLAVCDEEAISPARRINHRLVRLRRKDKPKMNLNLPDF